MPYVVRRELPTAVRTGLPDQAQKIYLEAYNSAWDQYKDSKDRKYGSSREETAHRVAWGAVKKTYQKNNRGQWRKKEG